MKETNLAVAVVVLAVLAGIVAMQKQEVKSGMITTCKQCGKVIQDSSVVLRVPWWKADDYHIGREVAYCDVCGNESVSYTINVRCQRCGTVYNTYSQSVCRRQEPHDASLTEGYCSDHCRNIGRIEHTVDKGSHAVGNVLGRVGKGIADGIRKHGR